MDVMPPAGSAPQRVDVLFLDLRLFQGQSLETESQFYASLLQLAPEEVMMVAAHPDDLRAAAGQGLATAYVRRPREWGPATVVPEPDPAFDAVANDLVDLAGRL